MSASEKDNVIAVRTRNDQREVLVWLSSPEETRALRELLPSATTPEFLERKRQHEEFRENLKAIAPRAPPVTPAIIGVNVAVFVIMLAFGAGLTAINSRVHLLFGANYGPLTWSGQEGACSPRPSSTSVSSTWSSTCLRSTTVDP